MFLQKSFIYFKIYQNNVNIKNLLTSVKRLKIVKLKHYIIVFYLKRYLKVKGGCFMMQSNVLSLRNFKSVAKSNRLQVFAKYFCVFLCFIVTSFASVNYGTLTPFAFGLYFALLMFKFNPYALSGLYLFASSLAGWSLIAIYSAVNVVLVGLMVTFIHKKAKRKINKWLMLLYALIGNATYLFFHMTTLNNGIATVTAVLLGLLFLVASIHFLQATIGKGFNFKLNIDEVICGSAMLIVFSMGFAALEFFNVEFIKIFAVICILSATYLLPGFSGLFVGAIIGLGGAIYTNNISLIAVFVTFSLIAKAFKSNNKIFSCVAIILCEIVFGLYFNAYAVFSIYSVISVIVAEILFLLIPTKFLNSIGDLLGGAKEKVGVRSIVNQSKEGISNRMNEIANVFSEMDSVFRTMVKGVMPLNEAKKMLTSEVIGKITKACPEMNKSFRLDEKTTREVFNDIIAVGFERGKVTLLDIPQYITSRCTKTNYLINTINQLLTSYKHYAVMVTNMDSSRILIAEQLSGISSILKTLASEVNLNITFDQGKEERIIEELSYKNIYCVEAIVYEQNAYLNNTTLVVKDTNINLETVEKIVSKIIGSKMKVTNTTPSSVSGCSVIQLKTVSRHDIVFGSASAGKSGEMVSGDTHSLIKIDDGKFMVALCDGMGSGKVASETSNLAISLIENFYKAGFDNEIILNSVNKLLSLNNEEVFSAVDICVIDTRKAICDFVKLGSPEGFIKHKNNTEVIETCGLPMGVLEEMKPHITKKVLNDFDIIILVSDGITQSFEEHDNLTNFINNLNSVNPQTIADEILDRAVDLNNGVCSDDMTVVAVRVFPIS